MVIYNSQTKLKIELNRSVMLVGFGTCKPQQVASPRVQIVHVAVAMAPRPLTCDWQFDYQLICSEGPKPYSIRGYCSLLKTAAVISVIAVIGSCSFNVLEVLASETAIVYYSL